ncbi:MAG: 6-hydroxymethylpterin diphosphokinase MptE-like protein [Pseudomonadota bacterium]
MPVVMALPVPAVAPVMTLDKAFPKRSETAIILGNGPTVLETLQDAVKLQKEKNAVVFGVNRVYMLPKDVIPFHYFCAVDNSLWEQFSKEILGMKCLAYFIREKYYAPLYNLYARVNFQSFQVAQGPREFAQNIGDRIAHGFTSVYPCMQFAYIQGAKEVHLYGVDYKKREDGQTHFWGTTSRTAKGWAEGRKTILLGIEKLRALGCKVEIHSRLFEL